LYQLLIFETHTSKLESPTIKEREDNLFCFSEEF